MKHDQHRLQSSAAIAGRAIGAMFFSAFGGAWLGLWAYSEFGATSLALVLIGAVSVVLLALAYRAYRSNAPALRELEHTPKAKYASRWFNIINVAQWVAIVMVAMLLSTLGHGSLVLPAVIFIIGLHFLPLAWLFGYAPHYVTGLSLMLLAAVYPVASHEGGGSSIGALGAGLILWASAIWAIVPRATQTANARENDT